MKKEIPPRLENVCLIIKEHIRNRDYRFSEHAVQRGLERSISFADALYVLKNGVHNEKKTCFDARRCTWKYAIEGKTTADSLARIIVAFEKGMVIITVIKLFKKAKREKR